MTTTPHGLIAYSVRGGLAVLSLPASDRGADLTRAEREVARAVIAGLSNAEIARERGRSERTVANQIASVFRKLRSASRTELAARFPSIR
ncbi:MAG: response regulator transcription factor [Polyangiales bacterium]